MKPMILESSVLNFNTRLNSCISIIHFALTSPKSFYNLYRIKKLKLTYLNLQKLINLSKCVQEIDRKGIPGVIVEAGCALGGSAILISLNKEKSRELNIYDTFAQIPPPSEKDESDAVQRYQTIINGRAKGIHDGRYYGYEEDLMRNVIDNFHKFDLSLEENNIYIHRGLFQDVLKITKPVAMAHIDSDWYDSIYTSLERIIPKLSRNGIVLIDDFYDWKGAKKAVNDFFADKKDHYKFIYGPQLVIRKIAEDH